MNDPITGQGANNAAKTVQDSSKFEMSRVKIYFGGYSLTPDLTYKLQLNITQGNVLSTGKTIEEAYLNYRFVDEAQLRFGQDKVPFARQFIISSTADSPIPAIRSTRRRPTVPPALSESCGRTRFPKISFISDGTPGRMMISVSPRFAQNPGAVPLGFTTIRAPAPRGAGGSGNHVGRLPFQARFRRRGEAQR